MLRGFRAAVLSVLALALLAGPAFAGSLPSEHFAYSFPVEIERCGTTWTGTYSSEGVALLRFTDDDSPPLFTLNYSTTIVWTDALNPERTYTAVLQGMWKDQSATLVEGTIYEFEAIEVGQPYTIRTPDGRIVMHDRGLIRWRSLIDTKGDDDGGNDEFLADLGGAFRGRFPSFDLTTEEFCAIIDEAAAG
jgi:hypothetical protein